MKKNLKQGLITLGMVLAAAGAQAETNLIVNGDFESSSVGVGGFQYIDVAGFNANPVSAAGWTFASNTGTGIINRNGWAWGGAASFSAVAFLQDHSIFRGAAPVLTQTFSSNGSDYLLSFDIGQRPAYNTQDVTVKLDGVTVATGLGAPAGGVSHYSFNIAGITGQSHTLTFTSAFTAGDAAAFVDNVSLSATAFQAAAVPEPASFGLMGLGLGLMGVTGAMRRRQQRAA